MADAPIFPFLAKKGAGVEPHKCTEPSTAVLGMLLIMNREEAEKAKGILAAMNEPVYEVGTIEEGNRECSGNRWSFP